MKWVGAIVMTVAIAISATSIRQQFDLSVWFAHIVSVAGGAFAYMCFFGDRKTP